MSNPLNLTTEYVWQDGDTFMLIAAKYRRTDQWLELLDLNKVLLYNNRYRMCTGDTIQVPPSWFPLPDFSFTTKFVGSSGYRT